MSSILEFRKPALSIRQVTATNGATGSADIVLFPGVRYERWAEAPPEPEAPRRSSRRRRDHLDLDD
jgi:hypothetical protein